MSRSTQYIGFPEGYSELLRVDTSKSICPTCKRPAEKYLPKFKTRLSGESVEGMFGELVYECQEYLNDKNKIIYKETEQCSPWSSGPCIFMKLVDGKGKDILSWSEDEVNSYL